MPSTVYKGDLTEVTFGHESGLTLNHGYAGSNFKFTASFDPNVPAPANAPHQNLTKDTSVIVFDSGAANTPVNSGILRYPNGMLVGSKVTFSIGSTSPNWSTNDDYSVTGRTYTIIKQEVANDTNSQNNNKTEITVTPALKTDHTTADKDSKAGDTMYIHSFTTPTIDVSMVHNDAANLSAERVLTDQFVGLVSTIALPETKVDLKRYHVVGLGRDVAVQVPGRYLNQGGSFECNIHNGRWFNYCLGQEVVKLHANTKETGQNTYSLLGSVSAGDNFLMFDGNSSWPTINSVQLAVGDYIILDSSTEMVDVQTYRDTGVNATIFTDATCDYNNDPTITMNSTAELIVGMGVSGTGIPSGATVSSITNSTTFELSAATTGGSVTNGTLTFDPTYVSAWPNAGATQIFDKALKTEVRRIAAVQRNGAEYSVWLDDSLLYDHANNLVVKFAKYQTDASNGSPHRDSSTGNLTQPVEHLFFSRSTIPSFSMEVSIRRRDADSNEGTTDGGSGDSKQLTRVFRGCKVKDFSLTADTDAALRLTTNFDSALCYTDTGRLESTKGDRYDTHRLFEDTANTEVERKKAGIEKGTQKPFMFYNGSISVAGTTLGQVVSFTLNGKTGVEQFYTISGANIADAATDQVPHAGTRNPKLAVEGKTEYDLEMEIIVDDPLFYHKVRRAVDHFDDTDETAQTDADMIRLSFVKQGTGADRESIDILIDDYFITEAPLPIPEDKGPIRSALKILPKTFKVISKDTILHA
ncbi:autotransporter-associated beta strand repeat protein [uncultured Mediterranean phage]|nr:autotransporter-associated beta strand repeat protein [uncultured Mediterranean phage]